MNYKSLFEIVNADENILWNILSKVEKIVFVALTFKLLSSLNSRLLVCRRLKRMLESWKERRKILEAYKRNS
jgi:hypothetical protein